MAIKLVRMDWSLPKGAYIMSTRDFHIYNILDSMSCLEAFTPIMDEIMKDGNIDAYDSAVSLLYPLMAMQYRGMRFDLEGVKRESVNADVKIAELQEKVNTTAGKELNVNSSKQLQHYFYKDLGLQPYTNRATGNVSTDEEALIRIARKGYKEAHWILEIRQLRKLKSAYLDVKLDADGRLRGSADPAGTTTGRLAVRKTQEGTGLNTQTLPHSLYPYILADEGYLLYSIDLSQAENRIVAYIAPEPAMIMAFENKVDIHKQTASLIYSKPIEEIEYEERQWGKKSNHGLNYGLGFRSFGMIHRIQEAFAKWVVESYHRAYPGVRQWHENIKLELSANRCLENLFGRRRRFYDRWGEDLFKDAYSYVPQSTVAEMINRRAILYSYYTDHMQVVDLLNNMHDGLWFQIPISAGLEVHERCLRNIRASLEAPLKYKAYEFSIPLSAEVGFNLGPYQEADAEKPSVLPNLKGTRKINWNEPIVPQLQLILGGQDESL
jgi:DNA polymerase I